VKPVHGCGLGQVSFSHFKGGADFIKQETWTAPPSVIGGIAGSATVCDSDANPDFHLGFAACSQIGYYSLDHAWGAVHMQKMRRMLMFLYCALTRFSCAGIVIATLATLDPTCAVANCVGIQNGHNNIVFREEPNRESTGKGYSDTDKIIFINCDKQVAEFWKVKNFDGKEGWMSFKNNKGTLILEKYRCNAKCSSP
jgi:hypothetical protein